MNCKNFSPNIFNQTQCQNCFKFKDGHSLKALEKNRATRKMEKCGYLFIAPDWDFTIPVNRTKRWQRRWFTLYDDGELTYSLDEQPDTLPQGVIDMNKVLKITDAVQSTGNDFSISLEMSEKVHYIKGTSKEEKKWWFDILVRYPKIITQSSRLRQNANFSTKSVTISENKMIYKDHMNEQPKKENSSICSLNCNMDSIKLNSSENDLFSENKFNNSFSNLISNHSSFSKSCLKLKSGCDVDLLNAINKSKKLENINPLPLRETNNLISNITKNELSRKGEILIGAQSSYNIKIDDSLDYGKLKSRRYLKKDLKSVKNQRSRSDGVLKMIPSFNPNQESNSHDSRKNDSNLSLDSVDYCDQQNSIYYFTPNGFKVKKPESLEDITNSSNSTNLPRRRHYSEKIENLAQKFQFREACKENKSNKQHLSKSKSMISLTSVSYSNRSEDEESAKTLSKKAKSFKSENYLQTRGDPDGRCLDSTNSFSSNSEIEFKKQDVLIKKKGWLFRLGLYKEWFKHWFILTDHSLTYFRDPDSGILDGVIDFSLIKSVSELDLDKNYAFELLMWDDQKHILAAITSCLRNKWIEAIKTSATIAEQLLISESSSITNNIITKSAEDTSNNYLNDDQPEYYSVINHKDEYKILPPSPPVNRTIISKVKEKARSRSTSRSRIAQATDLEESSQNLDLNSPSNSSDTSQDQKSCSNNNKIKVSDNLNHLNKAHLINHFIDLQIHSSEKQKDAHFKTKYECLRDKYEEEKAKSQKLIGIKLNEHCPALNNHQDVINQPNRLIDYKNNLKKSSNMSALNDSEMINLNESFEGFENENKLKTDNEVAKLKLTIKELENLCQIRLADIDECNKKITKLRNELKAKEELFHRCELEKDKIDHQLCNTVKIQIKERSESNKTIENLKENANRLLERLKQLNQSVNESNINYDYLEIAYNKLKNNIKYNSELHQAEMNLMKARINDLTLKLTVSEKSLRQAKLKITKYEAKEERRRNTMRIKDLNASKNFETKLQELENKIAGIQIILLGNDQHSPDEGLPPVNLDSSPNNVSRKCHKESGLGETALCSPIH